MLEIDIECRKGLFFIRLNGILNNETVFKFKEEVIDIIELNGIKNIVFNLENLCYIDETGVDFLNKLYKFINRIFGNIYICNLKNNIVNKKIRNSNLLEHIEVVKNELDILHQIQI